MSASYRDRENVVLIDVQHDEDSKLATQIEI